MTAIVSHFVVLKFGQMQRSRIPQKMSFCIVLRFTSFLVLYLHVCPKFGSRFLEQAS